MSESGIIVFIATNRMRHEPLFSVGQIIATPGALDLFDRTGTNASDLICRHQFGDWGSICEADRLLNNEAVVSGDRLLSAYELGPTSERIWIITEWDRTLTTLLLPEEY